MPKQTIAQKSVYWMKVISLGLVLGLGIQFAQAWTSPTLSPPNGNVSGPLTTSSVGQWKQGNLALNTDGLYANALLIPNGNVGIGTVNPIVPVHLFSTNPGGYTEQMLIEGTGNEGGYLRLQGKWPLLRFMSSVAPSGKKGFAFQNDGAGRLVLGTLGDDLGWKNSTSSRVMSWTSDENVGVGTVDPAEKLEVNGNVKTTGILTAGKVQIVDVVVENTDCTQNGLVAKDNTGVILSCQGSPLKWKKASGGSAAIPCHWIGGAYVGQLVITCNDGYVADMSFIGA